VTETTFVAEDPGPTETAKPSPIVETDLAPGPGCALARVGLELAAPLASRWVTLGYRESIKWLG
jgi:hypothetical protein